MIASMTGYGRAEAVLTGMKVTIEIKSLNSKQTDISLKLPSFYREKEPEIRNFLTQKLERGKIDLYTTTEITGDTSSVQINKPLALHYYRELKGLISEMPGEPEESLLPVIMKMPDILQTGREEISENDWTSVMNAITQAVAGVLSFRESEGKTLEKDIRQRLQNIVELMDSIGDLEAKRTEDIRERILKEFSKLSGSDQNALDLDSNRFEQELIYYLEKLDITEEKVRLGKHCGYFLETLDESSSQGKKLGFIVQEMGREINTIGSKANDAGIQKIVVKMKDELEKIREQLGNIL